VKRKSRTVAIVEIAQEPGATIELQQDNVRFLERICELASDRIGKLADGDSILNATPIPNAAPAAVVGKKRWWQVWKK
jgi:hypothetical protein